MKINANTAKKLTGMYKLVWDYVNEIVGIEGLRIEITFTHSVGADGFMMDVDVFEPRKHNRSGNVTVYGDSAREVIYSDRSFYYAI